MHRTLALLADRRVRLALLFAILASLAFYLVTSQSGLLGSATGERAEDCPSTGPPSPASVSRAELSGLREGLRPVVAGIGAGLYEQGVVDSGYMWSDGLPGTGPSLPSGSNHPGAYEMRWWLPDRNDVVADVLVFDSAGKAHDFFERASSPRCRPKADAIDAPSPAGGRNLVWLNPDGFAQEDLFLQRGRRVYRVGTVLAGLSHKVTFIGRIAGFLLVNELACALPGAECQRHGILALRSHRHWATVAVVASVDESSTETLRLAEDMYKGFRDEDLAFFDFLDPEIEMLTPFGDVHGIDEVVGFFENSNGLFEEMFPEPEEFIPAGDRVTVLGTSRGRVKATGAPVEARFAHVWQCREGKMVSCRNYVDSAKILQALRGT